METATMLETEFKYYLDNQEELVMKYNNKQIVIVGKEVIGAYDTLEEAYFETIQKYKPGTFLIQLCTPGEEEYTQTYHSNVAFL